MTEEQKWDRLERIARLLAQPDLRSQRESRKEFEKLKALVEKHRQDDARLANLRKAQSEPESFDKLKALLEKYRKDHERFGNVEKRNRPEPDTDNS